MACTILDIINVSIILELKPRIETDVLFIKSVMSWMPSDEKSGDPDRVLAA